MRDRLEVIEVSGYTVDEKVTIADRHLWDKEHHRHGLASGEAVLAPEVIEHIITNYTWEAGCRDLSRRLGDLARGRAMAKAEEREKPLSITRDEVKAILGPPTRRDEDKREKEGPLGVVTGLAWTAAGGDIMFVEAVAMPGKGHLTLTGQLGDVMKESAQAAVCYVRSRARDWYLYDNWFKENDIHIHIPHGAIPKDGPSAGVTLATAIVSLVSGQKVKPDVAMTGEITLRGLVLPIGGLKEKLLAAKRAGLSAVLIPKGNLGDLQQLSPSVTQGLTIIPVSTLDDVLEQVLMCPEGLFGAEAMPPLGPENPINAWTEALRYREAKLALKHMPLPDRDTLKPETSNFNVA